MAKKIYQTNRFNKTTGNQDQVVNSQNEDLQDDDPILDLTEVKEEVQDFWGHYQKFILGAVAGVILIFGGWYAYKHLYQEPRQQKAVEQMFQAELMFEKDSFNLALTNPGGGFSGFLDIINSYSGTKAANLSKYYAGVCYLNTGDYENAAKYLNDFSPEGAILPITKYGALGDAYSELGKMDEALNNYKKACSEDRNDVLTPYYLKKLALFYEKQGKPEEAIKVYRDLKTNYLRATEGREADKYILRLEAKGVK